MIVVSFPKDDSAEATALVEKYQARIRAAVDASLEGMDEVDARIIKLALTLDNVSFNPSYDAKMSTLREVVAGCFELFEQLRPGMKEIWKERTRRAREVMAGVEAQIEKEHHKETVQ